MSELEELKARAAERRTVARYDPENTDRSLYKQRIERIEADLDRAIAIAEEQYEVNGLLLQGKDGVVAEFHRGNATLERERDEARADVLALRPFVVCVYEQDNRHPCGDWTLDEEKWCDPCRALADTKSYEQYR